MTLVSLIVVLIIVGFLSWLVLKIPMAANMQQIIVGVICFFVVLWLIQELGFINLGLRLR